jgi:hypothetical protein
MKIYFAASIMGGREDVSIYSEIIAHLKKYGIVLTEHIGKSDIGEAGEHDKSFVHNRDMTWLLSSDVIIAEVSTPSLGVGYEIGRAIENHKKILCLYRNNSPKGLSGMISGNPHLNLQYYNNIDEAKQIIDKFFRNEE